MLTNVAIQTAIQRKTAALAVRADYSIARWLGDVLDDIATAKAAGSHSAVMRGRELVGRHIGALTNSRSLSRDEAEVFTFLGAAMSSARQARGQAIDAQVVTVEAVVVDGDGR